MGGWRGEFSALSLSTAQAIARDATLITRNGKDFRKIKELKLVEWEPREPVAAAK